MLLVASAVPPARAGVRYLQDWSSASPTAGQYISVTSTGKLFYALAWRANCVVGVEVYDLRGRKLRFLKNVEKKARHCREMAASRRGSYYLWSSGIAFEFGSDGSYLGQTVTADSHIRVRGPGRIATGPAGLIYIADPHINVAAFDRLGEPVHVRGLPFGGWARLRGLSVNPEGLVAVSAGGRESVGIFSPALELRASFGRQGTSRGHFSGVGELAITRRIVAVADRGNRRVQVFDLNGCYLASIDGVLAEKIAASDTDAILVLERGRVSCFRRKYLESEPRGPFAAYLDSLDLFERGKPEEATVKLRAILASEADHSLKTAAANALSGGTLCLRRHILPPRPPTETEAAALAERRVRKNALFAAADPERKGFNWVAIEEGFVALVEPDENVITFEGFARVNGLARATASAIEFTEGRVWAATDRGLCYFDGRRGAWRLYTDDRIKPGSAVSALKVGAGGLIVEFAGGSKVELKLPR